MFNFFSTNSNKKVYCILNSSFQITILNYLRRKDKEYKSCDFIIFDLNRNLIGRKQLEQIIKNYNFIIYKGKLTKLKFFLFIISNLIKRNQIIHGNYNSLSFKILAILISKNLNLIDDGGNTALFPFRIEHKFRKFYTIFPEIQKISYLKKFTEIINLRISKDKTIKAEKSNNKIYICASADVEVGRVDEDDYFRIIKILVEKFIDYNEIIYYPHRRETDEKLQRMSSFIKLKKFKILNPKSNFEKFIDSDKNFNSPIITLGSTLEKTLNIFLDKKLIIYPIRITEFLKEQYILNYLIHTSLLSNSYSKKDIFLIRNNKIISLYSFIKNKLCLAKNFTQIKLNSLIEIEIKKNYKHLFKWSGHPLAIDKNFNLYILNCCKNESSLLKKCVISPQLMIGKVDN